MHSIKSRFEPLPLCALCALIGLLAVLASAPSASASSTQLALFQDDLRLVHSGAEVRERRLDELKALGVDVIKVQLRWSDIAPVGERKPGGFRGERLESYDDGEWREYDDAIRAAYARGIAVLLTPVGSAPGWATARAGDERGIYRPSAREFGRFVRAAGVRYDGSRRDSSGTPLPRVGFWSIWNEPNHPDFLQPLGSARRQRAIAPHIYRDLVRHALDGLRRSGHARDGILFGELLPIGRARYGTREPIRPLRFLREFFCLDSSYRPLRGGAAHARGCPRSWSSATWRMLGGVAHHPYTRPNGPARTREPSADDVTIRTFSRLGRAMDRIAARRPTRRGMALYNTEFGYQSDPPDPYQANLRSIPAFLSEAEWMSYRNPRVRTWSQYTIADDELTAASGAAKYGSWQGGLYYADGRRKESVYNAYRLPFFVRLLGSRTVEIWGAARPEGSRGRTVELQQRLGGGGWRRLRTMRIGNGRGYFRDRIRVTRASSRIYRFVYEGEASRSARAARR